MLSRLTPGRCCRPRNAATVKQADLSLRTVACNLANTIADATDWLHVDLYAKAQGLIISERANDLSESAKLFLPPNVGVLRGGRRYLDRLLQQRLDLVDLGLTVCHYETAEGFVRVVVGEIASSSMALLNRAFTA